MNDRSAFSNDHPAITRANAILDDIQYKENGEPKLPLRLPPDIGPMNYRRFRGIDVTTDAHANGLIEQTIDIAGYRERRVLITADEHIREALIALGWTPPADKEDLR